MVAYFLVRVLRVVSSSKLVILLVATPGFTSEMAPTGFPNFLVVSFGFGLHLETDSIIQEGVICGTSHTRPNNKLDAY